MLRFHRKQQNSVKQLCFNKKINQLKKLNIEKKTKMMAYSPIASWQIEKKKVEAVTEFLLGSRITVDGDCSQEIRTQLLLGRKAMINLDSVLKSRDVALLTKVRIVKAKVFPAVMYGCESWAKRRQSAEELMLLNHGAGEDS